MDTITGHAPDLTVPGLCHHLPLRPGVTDTVDLRTSQDGTEAHAALTVGYTATGEPVKLSGGPAAVAVFEDIALHAMRCASWLRGTGA